ncbi:hypothetical protein KP509_20G031700 [Ceratopteris richardii]|uniref:Uncharacterized protein n=1 Tax=Ceratopteris richardii TaxID=49495 RepID=A0A8T2SHQ9_CERRI|nr:hypothetical protein KP509_20G031700 [Ceratopteris richardii]
MGKTRYSDFSCTGFFSFQLHSACQGSKFLDPLWIALRSNHFLEGEHNIIHLFLQKFSGLF